MSSKIFSYLGIFDTLHLLFVLYFKQKKRIIVLFLSKKFYIENTVQQQSVLENSCDINHILTTVITLIIVFIARRFR